MICYRDKAFCAEGDDCPAREGCNSYFSQEEHAKAAKWWGDSGAPICFRSMAETCDRRKGATP